MHDRGVFAGRLALTLLTAVLVLATAGTASAGSVRGKITYDGKVPNLRPLNMEADPACEAKYDKPVQPDMLVLGDGNALGNVFVQIKNAPAVDLKVPSEPVIVDQQGCLYTPKVVGAFVGQTVRFKNSDGILHNVHGLPKVNQEFNIGMPPAFKERDHVFNQPEPVFPVKCDVHPWMKAYVAVMTHPFFAVTGESGTFEIGDLPDGEYEIEAWHERLGTQTSTVEVRGGAASVSFSFKAPSR